MPCTTNDRIPIQEVPCRKGQRPWELVFELQRDDPKYVMVSVQGYNGGLKARFRVNRRELTKALTKIKEYEVFLVDRKQVVSSIERMKKANMEVE